jgi:hypothetical protein
MTGRIRERALGRAYSHRLKSIGLLRMDLSSPFDLQEKQREPFN